MPPFVSAECPYCKNKNRFDVAELRKTNGFAYKMVIALAKKEQEFIVICSQCGRKFKITVPPLKTEIKVSPIDKDKTSFEGEGNKNGD